MQIRRSFLLCGCKSRVLKCCYLDVDVTSRFSTSDSECLVVI